MWSKTRQSNSPETSTMSPGTSPEALMHWTPLWPLRTTLATSGSYSLRASMALSALRSCRTHTQEWPSQCDIARHAKESLPHAGKQTWSGYGLSGQAGTGCVEKWHWLSGQVAWVEWPSGMGWVDKWHGLSGQVALVEWPSWNWLSGQAGTGWVAKLEWVEWPSSTGWVAKLELVEWPSRHWLSGQAGMGWVAKSHGLSGQVALVEWPSGTGWVAKWHWLSGQAGTGWVAKLALVEWPSWNGLSGQAWMG